MRAVLLAMVVSVSFGPAVAQDQTQDQAQTQSEAVVAEPAMTLERMADIVLALDEDARFSRQRDRVHHRR